MTSVQALNIAPAESDTIKSGISAPAREQIAAHLSAILGETYLLTIRSHLVHWNVVGPLFKSVHDLTEEHYKDMFAAADVIAERIRALGHRAPVNAGDISIDMDIACPARGCPPPGRCSRDLSRRTRRLPPRCATRPAMPATRMIW